MISFGNYQITKAYIGETELSQIYQGEFPLLEDLKPDLWIPFENSLDISPESKIQSVSGSDGALVNWKQNMMDIMPDGNGAKLKNSNGVLITNFNIPDTIFTVQRTYSGQTIPASNVCASCWLKLNKDDVTSWFGAGGTYYNGEVRNCYYDNGTMYTDSAHTNPITPVLGTIYYTVDGAQYNWTGSAYQKLTYQTNGLILGTPDGYSFFGWTFENEFTSSIRAVRLMLGNRASGYPTDIALCRIVIPYDTWFHLAFNADIKTKTMTAYYNGVEMGSSSTTHGFPHWAWAIQAPPWTMMGNYRAIKLPFIFKDLRIYGHTLSNNGIKYIMKQGQPS